MSRYAQAAAYADRIEQELKALGWWREGEMPESAYDSEQAFYADTMTYAQWLQFVLLRRVRDILEQKGEFPGESMVGAKAVREFDGYLEAQGLVQALCEFDEFIERKSARPSKPPRPKTHTPPPPPPVVPVDTPLEVAQKYWRTRDPLLLHPNPHSGASFDTTLSQRVFESVSVLVEILEEQQPADQCVLLKTFVEAERGTWLILTALRMDESEWKVDWNLSILHTTQMFLRQRQPWPPYTESDDARGRAMQFWNHLLNGNRVQAQALVFPPDTELPSVCAGSLDQFVWYRSHSTAGDTATVRVLVNTLRVQSWRDTPMRLKNGIWFVVET